MTRKDYVLISAAMFDERGPHFSKDYSAMTEWEKGTYDAWNTAVLALADAIGRDNPSFDRERFFADASSGRAAIAKAEGRS